MTDWTERFLKLAEHVAQWSKDPSTKVGAVIVAGDKRVVAMGYNGFPDRVNDDPAMLADRDGKLDLMIHAEMNAVLNATASVRGCDLYVSHPPCKDCAKLIVQAGIAQVFYRSRDDGFSARWMDNLNKAKDIFLQGRVRVSGIWACHRD